MQRKSNGFSQIHAVKKPTNDKSRYQGWILFTCWVPWRSTVCHTIRTTGWFVDFFIIYIGFIQIWYSFHVRTQIYSLFAFKYATQYKRSLQNKINVTMTIDESLNCGKVNVLINTVPRESECFDQPLDSFQGKNGKWSSCPKSRCLHLWFRELRPFSSKIQSCTFPFLGNLVCEAEPISKFHITAERKWIVLRQSKSIIA